MHLLQSLQLSSQHVLVSVFTVRVAALSKFIRLSTGRVSSCFQPTLPAIKLMTLFT